MTRTFQIEAGQKLLKILSEHGGWIDTTRLTTQAGYATPNQAQIRTILYKLRSSGAVKLREGGKNMWMINTRQWDHFNPFREIEADNLLAPRDAQDPNENLRGELNAISRRVLGSNRSYPSPSARTLPADYFDGGDDNEDTPSKRKTEGLELRVKALEQELHKEEKKSEEMQEQYQSLKKELQAVKEKQTRNAAVIEIPQPDGKVVKLKKVVLPSKFETVLALARNRRPILLVGPAGCGKTYLGELVAKALEMEFSAISCTSGMSESYLLGRSIPNIAKGTSSYQSVEFIERYEKGGVMLVDEIDASDPNMLLCINGALANGYCNVPNRTTKPKAMMHKDFVLIATANTFGRGANRVYAGRNQLDESTLDRFRIGVVECDYDPIVEESLCPDNTLRETIQKLRNEVTKAGVRRVVSTRFIKDAYVMHKSAQWTYRQIMDTLVQGWTSDELDRVEYKRILVDLQDKELEEDEEDE